MAAAAGPRLYLVTPARFEPEAFLARLAALLDGPLPAPVACLRLALPGAGEDEIRRAADRLRAFTEPRDLALLVEAHWRLVRPHGLDGVHLPDGSRELRAARQALGPELTVGAFCGASRHLGLVAAEAGADYVAFGPFVSGLLGPGRIADAALVRWWGELIETPLVAEGGLDAATVAAFGGAADFLAPGPGIWDDPRGPAGALAALLP